MDKHFLQFIEIYDLVNAWYQAKVAFDKWKISDNKSFLSDDEYWKQYYLLSGKIETKLEKLAKKMEEINND